MALNGQNHGLVAAWAVVMAAALAGCVRVPPAPVSLPAQAEARGRATMNWAAVREQSVRLMPQAQALDGPLAAHRLDQATLFAALLVHDPRIAEARTALDAAQKAARAARKVGAPTLSLSAEYANDPATRSPWALGAVAGLPLDIGGQRQARRTSADLAVTAAGLALAETIWSERMVLVRALAELQAAQQLDQIEATLMDLRARQLTALERRAAQGEIAALALAPYRALQVQGTRLRDEASARVRGARSAIAGVLGLPVAALDGVSLDWPEYADPAGLNGPVDDTGAVAARSDILRTLVAYDQAEADLRGEVARQYPALTIGSGYTWERGLVKLPFSLGLALPSWDLNHAAIAAAEVRRQQAGAAIESAIAGARNAIEVARAEHRAALAGLILIRSAELPQSRLVAERADHQLDLGAIGRADWAASQIAAAEAARAEVDALLRVHTAQAALEDALRRPLSGPETTIITPSREERP